MKSKSKLGVIVSALYLILVLFGIKGFFDCNGFQFHDFHGKCSFGFFSFPFGFLSSLLELQFYYQDPWDFPPIWVTYTFAVVPIFFDLLLAYGVGWAVETVGLKVYRRVHKK